MKLSRRRFLHAAVSAAPLIVPSSALGLAGTVAPSNRLMMGCIGIGGQGTLDLKSFMAHPDVQVVAVCDVRKERQDRAKSLVDEQYRNHDCSTHNDFREVIARDDIDAILCATPDHWHALIAIAAAKAGKDIYCEKPISLTVAEGRAVVDAANRYGIVYQSGTQRRSIGCFRYAVDVARKGLLGRIHTIHTYLDPGPACDPQPVEPVPEGFDYDFWLGPAPYAPYTTKRCLGSFRWIYDYSGGQLTDIGAHFNDLAQWGNNSDRSGPIRYEGQAEFPKTGLFDTPVKFHVEATYADGVKLIFHDISPRTVKFEGDEGWISVDDDGNVDASPASLLRLKSIVKQNYSHWESHTRDFLDCVKTRSQTVAPPEVAHRSSTTCHLGNICLRLNRPLQWDLQAERFVNDPEADKMLTRAMRPPWRL